jgi:RimJ/RimL family protein N-acetyltransferase
MAGGTFLRGERVTLRTVEEDDLEFISETVADPQVRRPLTMTRPINSETTREHFEERISGDDSVDLAVCLDGEIRGLIWLFDVDNTAGHCEVGYWLDPAVHGQGIMTEAAQLVVSYAFEELRMHRVRGRALVTNEASQGVLRNCGMTQEALAREAENVDGEYVDMVHLGVLREEWAEQFG